MICQLKQRYQLKKGDADMAIPAAKEFSHVSSYPLIESMGFDTDIYDGVAKMRAAIILGDMSASINEIKLR